MTRLKLLLRRPYNLFRNTTVLLRLVVALRRAGTVELWFGDSHAQCYNGILTSARIFRGADGQFVWHHGPRLMHSLATKDFDEKAQRFARFVGRIAPRGRVVPVVSTGEVDVRCHLVPRSTTPEYNLDFVQGYFRRLEALATTLGATHAVHAMHAPQARGVYDVPRYPIRGTLPERIGQSEALRAEVHRVADNWSGPVQMRVLDPTEDLADAEGALALELTDDGVHTNEEGIRRVRSRMNALMAALSDTPATGAPGARPQ